jgi:nuclear GTP-binding protein
MVKKKRQSKRVTLKDKYKIEKHVKEHKRKARRAARVAVRDGSALRKQKKNDPGIPNLWPFKEKLMRQMEAQRVRQEERSELLKEARKERQRGALSQAAIDSAAARSAAFTEGAEAAAAEAEETLGNISAGQKKRTYLRDLRSVVDQSDVILQVLDARDPLSCRAKILEKMVLEENAGKRIILVLNKIDLIPRKVAVKWLEYFRKEFPTIAFKASTQKQKQNLGRASKDSLSATRDGDNTQGDQSCMGADSLLQLLKNYSRNKNLKTAITVGVVGFPNVGKSSLINSLKRSRVVGVSATPGFTKTLQIVQLDKKVKLIDSPGVLFRSSEHGQQSSALALQNAIDPGLIEEPEQVVQVLVDRIGNEPLMQVYKVARFKSTKEFLMAVAHKRGKLTRGGIPDFKAAARQVLVDWNAGVIPFYSEPPVMDRAAQAAASSESAASAVIVQAWSKEFDLDALLAKQEADLVENVPDRHEDEFIKVEAMGNGEDADLMSDSDDEDEDDDEEDEEMSE